MSGPEPAIGESWIEEFACPCGRGYEVARVTRIGDTEYTYEPIGTGDIDDDAESVTDQRDLFGDEAA